MNITLMWLLSTRRTLAALSAALFFSLSLPAWAESRFYRIIEGPHPSPEEVSRDRFIYGSDVLYTGDAHGGSPVSVDGTVWHANLSERRYFVGRRNPVTDAREALALIEDDKWREARILMDAAPDAFPRTESMADVLRELASQIPPGASSEGRLQLISQGLRQRYPEGFFLKPIAGFNSAGTFPSDRTDFAATYRSYLTDVRPVVERRLHETGGDATTVHLELKGLKNYSGRVLEQLLEHPEQVIIQEKLRPAFGSVAREGGELKPLMVEYRVHVVEGRVLPGATQNRWEDARNLSPEELARVESFAQQLVDRLPAPMRKLCFGMDVMQAEDGLFKVIELNAGGESGYLYPDTDLWVAQLLAAHYLGHPTQLMREFERFRSAPTLSAKEEALEHLLKRPEMKALVDEVSPVTELLAKAKDVFVEEARRAPDTDGVRQALFSLKRFKLEPYLNRGDIEFLAGALGDSAGLGGIRLDLTAIEGLLQLGDSEALCVAPEGELRLLSGFNYDDAFVAEDLAGQLAREAAQNRRMTNAELARTAEELVRRRVVTRAELHGDSSLADAVLRDASEPMASGARLFYSGTREALVRSALEILFKL